MSLANIVTNGTIRRSDSSVQSMVDTLRRHVIRDHAQIHVGAIVNSVSPQYADSHNDTWGSLVLALNIEGTVYYVPVTPAEEDVGIFSEFFMVNGTTETPVMMVVSGVDDNNPARGYDYLMGSPGGDNSFDAIYLKNRTTGNWVKVWITGDDDDPVEHLDAFVGTPDPAMSYDEIRLLNSVTGNYIIIFAKGPDTDPTLGTEPA